MLKTDVFGRNSVLGYCMNVHSGNTVEAMIRKILFDSQQVKARVEGRRSEGAPAFGVGMWMSAEMADCFTNPIALSQLSVALRETQTRIFSWNAFPFGNFHSSSVKSAVYLPHWANRDRLTYTLKILNLIELTASDEEEISVSTVPIADLTSQLDPSQVRKAVDHLIEVVLACDDLEKKRGLNVHLNLEPEPLCYLQTSADVVTFFQEYLIPLGVPVLKRELSLTAEAAEILLLNKIRVCYDTCHAAILFETPRSILSHYDRLGIQIGKVQLSSALELNWDSHSRSQALPVLRVLAQDRYLHQVIGRNETFLDLPDALEKWDRIEPKSQQFRIHYHVPLFLQKFDCLETTQQHLLDLFQLAQTRPISNHWEVETYTWPHLTSEESIPEKIALEIDWVCRASLRHA